MIYKFYYYENFKEHIQEFRDERSACNFFDTLIVSHYIFKVITLGGFDHVKKRNEEKKLDT